MSQRYFSTDSMIKKISMRTKMILNLIFRLVHTEIIFSQLDENKVQKGNYIFIIDTYGIDEAAERNRIKNDSRRKSIWFDGNR